MGIRQTVDFDIIGPSNEQRIAIFDSQKSINFYPYTDTQTGNNALYPFAGSKEVLTFDVGGNAYTGRPGGSINTDTLAFIIQGDIVFRVDSTLTATNIGTIGTQTGPVSMALVGVYLKIVDGTSQWTYNIETGVFVENTDPELPTSPTYVCEQQGFVLSNNNQTQTLYQLAPYDPTRADALNTLQINYLSSIYSYPLIAQLSVNGVIFCFTSGFIQGLNNKGKTIDTFRPNQNLIFGYGAMNAASIAKGIAGQKGEQLPEFLIFPTNTQGARKVMITYGQAPEPVSSSSIETQLNALKFVNDAVGYTYNENGNCFYILSFKQENKTFALNITNGEWFNLETDGGRYFGESFCYFANKRLVTSYLDNKLYEISEEYETNNGKPIARTRISENIRIKGYKKFSATMLTLYCQQGIGLSGKSRPNMANYVYGSEALFDVYVSGDGGQTWKQPHEVSFGRIGLTTYVSRVTNMGEYRDFCVKVVVKEPLPDICLLGAMLDIIPMEGSQ